MAYIEWDDKYLVHIPELDEAHFGLFKLVNELYQLHNSEVRDSKKIVRTFHNFLEYTYSHFADEENYLEKTKYSQIDTHKKLHRSIKKQFEKHFQDLKDETLDMKAFLEFVKKWLQDHIMNEDQKYVS